MKLSEVPTDKIIIKARTNSEWDYVDFSIVTVDKSWQDKMEDFLMLNKKYHSSIEWLSFNDDEGFFVDTEGSPFEEFVSQDKKDWSFVEITDEEVEQLSTPENTLKYGSVRISDTIQFVMHGKHTSDEFYTESIPITDILQLKKEGV